MMYEPSRLEIYLTVAVGVVFSSIFKNYADRLDLTGSERVIELGPSAGNNSLHLARRLSTSGGCLTCVDISRRWTEVARRRLRNYPDIMFKCGDIANLDIPAHSQDVAVVSFVLHDIPGGDRMRVMQHLAATLKPEGKIFIREPLRFITQQEIRKLMDACGLEEISSGEMSIKTQGRVFEGVYRLRK
jgi:ubiquinone/menaquinone biosynthesis C-methylase UbiE